MHSSSPLSAGDIFEDSQWMPETRDGIDPYVYTMFFPVHTHL